MEETAPRPPVPRIRSLGRDVPLLKTVFLSTAAFTAAAHGFLFTNEFFSHDSISYYAYADWGLPFYAERGRFLIPLCELCKGGAAAPWLIGLLFTLWTALAAYLVIRMLDLRGLAGQVLTCGLLCTNLSLSLTGATYVYCMDEYALALLLAAAAAYLFRWSGRRKARVRRAARKEGQEGLAFEESVRLGGAALGVLALCGSLALYQPYFTVAAALCLLCVLRSTVRGERYQAAVLSGVRYLGLLAAGFVLYYGLWNILCAFLKVEKQRMDRSLLAEDPRYALEGSGNRLWDLITEANGNFFGGLFQTDGLFGGLMALVHVLLLMFLLWRLARLLRDHRLPAGNRVLLALLVCLLPTAFRSVSILAPGDDHGLTAYAGELFYLLPVVCMEAKIRRRFRPAVRTALAVLLGLVLWQHVVFANQAYMKKDLEKNATLVLASQIIGRIEAVEGYVPGQTPVAFAGRLDANAYFDRPRSAFGNLPEQVGLWHSYSATYNLGRYLTDYLHYPLSWDQTRAYGDLPEVRAMPLYPAEGSVAMVDGTVVVKLSNPRNGG